MQMQSTTGFAVLVAFVGEDEARQKMTAVLQQQGTIFTCSLPGLTVTYNVVGQLVVSYHAMGAVAVFTLYEHSTGFALYMGVPSPENEMIERTEMELTMNNGDAPPADLGHLADVAIEGLLDSPPTFQSWPEVSVAFSAVCQHRRWRCELPARLRRNIENARSLIAERLQIAAHA